MVVQTLKKEKQFQVEKEVLYQKSVCETHYSGKLESKWKGPYVITTILLNRAYKIADQGGVLQAPVNRNQLKLYNQQSLEPIVVIEKKPQNSL